MVEREIAKFKVLLSLTLCQHAPPFYTTTHSLCVSETGFGTLLPRQKARLNRLCLAS